MGYFGQKNYGDKMGGGNGGEPARYTIAQVGCFLTAFCNYLSRQGRSIDPANLNKIFTQRGIYVDVDDGVKDDLAWQSITAYDGSVGVTSTGSSGWPDSNNAIVKFAYTSPKTGAPTTHFCLVADASTHTIVDSWDGVIRAPGYYGNPVAWATYADIVPQAVVVNVQTPIPTQTSSATTGATYTLQRGDTVWSVAGRFGFSAADLIALNGITDVRNLPVGYVIHFPAKDVPQAKDSGYSIEVLAEPKEMHVSREGGAEKWAFGNVRQWSDFTSTGHTPENTNVKVYAIAKVIVGKDTAVYCMDELAVGNYAVTGAVANTIGYNWSDLADGSFVAPKEQPAPAPEPEPEPVPVVVAPPKPAPVADNILATTPVYPNLYKTTYQALPHPVTYVANETIPCHEYDNRRPDHTLLKGKAVEISGTFIYKGELLGRPTDVIRNGYWFGVPMDKVTSEDELLNQTVTLAQRAAMKNSLSFSQHVAVGIAWTASQLTKIHENLAKK
jgi:LysM repeat protein